MSKRAVIYARVSTGMQRDNYSIPTQIADCIQFAENKSYTLIGSQYVDFRTGHDSEAGIGSIPAFVDNFTSRELSRPGLDAAIAFLEVYGFDVIIVHAIDRLARDPYIRQTLEREFIARGAQIEYVLGNYEETLEGEARKDLDAKFAKWENAKRLERCNRGKKWKAESGKFVSGIVPYGYTINAEAIGGLAVIPEQAEIIRKIFHLYVKEKTSIPGILRYLDNTGCKAEAWAKTTVNRLLENSTYAGYFFYNKSKRIDRKHLEPRPRNEWIRIECQPIIDPELYEKAQAIKEMNRIISRKQPNRFYMLSGMVICNECERPYLPQTLLPSSNLGQKGRQHRKTETQSYRHRLKAGHCLNRQISAKLLEQMVWEKTLNILKNTDGLIKGYRQSFEQQILIYQKRQTHIETLERNLLKVKAKKQKLILSYLDSDFEMGKREFLEQKAILNSEAKEIEYDLAATYLEVNNIMMPVDLEILKKFAADISSGIEPVEKQSPVRKREILRMLHITVRISAEGIVNLDGWFTQSEMPKSDESEKTS